jgi:hypothetical protein
MIRPDKLDVGTSNIETNKTIANTILKYFTINQIEKKILLKNIIL